ncbi:Flp pilus assembly protein protease CpaA [Desulfitispora alkaliphila]|uniref:prepilin peptidase n=1 Tax=Desulfitispora alkaliphila TaxID=622674 RepID=UPI003D1BCFD6
MGIGLLIIPFALEGIGAGDVKLLGAVGALMGHNFVWNSFLIIAICGGALAIGILFYQKAVVTTLNRVGTAVTLSVLSRFKVNTLGNLSNTDADNTFPYGVAIVAGTIIALLMR